MSAVQAPGALHDSRGRPSCCSHCGSVIVYTAFWLLTVTCFRKRYICPSGTTLFLWWKQGRPGFLEGPRRRSGAWLGRQQGEADRLDVHWGLWSPTAVEGPPPPQEGRRREGGRGVRVSCRQATDTGVQAQRRCREHLRAGKAASNYTGRVLASSAWTCCFRPGACWSPL